MLAALALAVAVLVAGPAPAHATAASAAAPEAQVPASPERPADRRQADLADDVVLPGAAGVSGRYRIRYWPTNKVRYYETIPAKWQWSLDNAIDHWNGTGARIKLVKVSSRKRAELTISYGNTQGADGLGTLGYAPGPYMNFVRISPRYKRVDANDPEQRVWVARLFAHEIGHNLGYGHTGGQCSLMSPVFLFGACGPLSKDKPGYYICRYIDTALLTRHIRIYGGRAKQPAQHCLIEALPPQLADVRFSGGGKDGPVRIDWRVVRPPKGASLRVSYWKATACGPVPRGAASANLSITRTSWTDPVVGKATFCYAVQVLNRFGGAQKPVTKVLQRFVPAPVTPVLGTFTYVGADDEYRFSYTRRPGIDLQYAVVDLDEPGAVCATEPDGNVAHLVAATVATVYVAALRACYSFFATNQFGDRSDPVFVTVEVPAPTATPMVGNPVPGPDGFTVRVSATLPAGAAGSIGMDLRDGACPGVPPTDFEPYDGYEVAAGVYELFPQGEGAHCVLVAVYDDYGRVGPIVMKAFNVSFPAITVTPTVGPVTVSGHSAQLDATLPAGSPYRLGVLLVSGQCPSQPPAESYWYDGYEVSDGRWEVYAFEPGLHCILVAAVDDAHDYRHGPVVARDFTVVD